jgi:hypothetical protein
MKVGRKVGRKEGRKEERQGGRTVIKAGSVIVGEGGKVIKAGRGRRRKEGDINNNKGRKHNKQKK